MTVETKKNCFVQFFKNTFQSRGKCSRLIYWEKTEDEIHYSEKFFPSTKLGIVARCSFFLERMM